MHRHLRQGEDQFILDDIQQADQAFLDHDRVALFREAFGLLLNLDDRQIYGRINIQLQSPQTTLTLDNQGCADIPFYPDPSFFVPHEFEPKSCFSTL
jgi:hypothetical protein